MKSINIFLYIRLKLLLSICLAIMLFSIAKLQAQNKATVVVAANFKSAMDSIITIYEKQNPNDKIQVLYGASGKLYEQIQHGAPFDLFFSADMNFPEKLQEKGFATSKVKTYAIGKIVIWSKKIDPTILKMNSLLDVKMKKISIATPTTAPYGERAVESMKHFNLFEKVKDKLVFGENIAQTAQFVSFGAADIGIIALSDALSNKLKKEGGKFYIIPEKSYTPLKQGCVLLKHAKENATAIKFYDFVSSEKAVKIITHFGYSSKAK